MRIHISWYFSHAFSHKRCQQHQKQSRQNPYFALIFLSDKLDLLIDKNKYLDEYLEHFYGNDYIDGGDEDYTEYFDAKLLYASDEEIKKYVEEAITKAIEEEKARQAKLNETQEIQDRKTFEKLKKKYGWK